MFKDTTTRGMRALSMVFDALAFGVFGILFILDACAKDWMALIDISFAIWSAYDWWKMKNTKIKEVE